MTELRNHFPELFETNVAEKTWAQEIARLSTKPPYQLMGPAETERVLAEKLRIRISERGIEQRYELEEFAVYLRSKSAKNILGVLASELSTLATRAASRLREAGFEVSGIKASAQEGEDPARAGELFLTHRSVGIDDVMRWASPAHART